MPPYRNFPCDHTPLFEFIAENDLSDNIKLRRFLFSFGIAHLKAFCWGYLFMMFPAKRIVRLSILIFAFFMGCSGHYGKFVPQPENKTEDSQRELIDSWADYEIWLVYRKAQLAVIIFDWRHDDRTILAEGDWRKVEDRETWQEIVKENTTNDGDFNLPGDYPDGTSAVQGIWGPDDQLYGLIVFQAYSVSPGKAKLVDKNSIRLSLPPAPAVTNR